MIKFKRLLWIFGTLILLISFRENAVGGVIFNSSLSISERYTDNLFFNNKNREGEYSTFVRSSFKLTYSSQNVTLLAGYKGTVELHARNPKVNGYFQSTSFGIDLPGLSRRINGLEVKVVESFGHSPELPPYSFGEEAAETYDGIRVPRGDIFRNTAGIILGYPWSSRIRSSFTYMNRITRYDSPELDDSIGHNVDLEIAYQSSTRTRWSASYGFGVANFEEAESRSTHRGAIGAGHQISSSFSVNGNLGLIFFEDESAQLYLDSNISKRYKKGNLSLGFRSDAGQAGGETSTVTLNQRVIGRAIYAMGHYSSFNIQGAYGRTVSLPDKDLETISYEAGGGITVRLLAWLNGGVSYSHFNQRALGIVGTEGMRNQAMVTLTAVGPSWNIIK